jgi:hypothetical protein
MAQEFLVGFRLSEPPRASEALEAALSEAKASLEAMGVALKGWDYDGSERLLLVHISAPPELLERAAEGIARALSGTAGAEARLEKLSRDTFAPARSAVPSQPVAGFLLRAASGGLEGYPLGRDELLALLLFYFVGCDRERAILAAPFLGLDPDTVKDALDGLARKGYVDLAKGALLKPAERLLNAAIPALRARVGRVVEGVRVVDEEGNVEVFSAEKLAASLYGSGVPQSLIPAILDSLGASLRGRSVVSKRALVAMVSALLEDLEPDAGAGVRFASYVYALDRVYVRVGAGLSKPRWSFLRRLSREVLGERGLTPPPRLVELHAELLAREVRELVSSAPWGFEGRVLELEEAKRLAELAAPKVSVAWLELRSASAGELASEYWSRGVSCVRAAAESSDCAERKELALRGVLLLSSALLLLAGALPSNFVRVNLGALRSRLSKLPEDVRIGASRLCTLSAAVARSPAIAAPRESRKLAKALGELAEVAERLASAQRFIA